MRIGILGGSFDPPHFGHLLVARQTQEIVGLDRIWLMPYFAHSWDTTISSAKDRLAMARLIEEKGITVCDEEIKHKTKSYTIETVQRLQKQYSDEFFWIVGSDVLPEFGRWKDYKKLPQAIQILVFPRNGYPIPSSLPHGFRAIASLDLVTKSDLVVTSNISSTIVRNRLIKGLSVAGLIPDPVLLYIKKHSLYR